MRMEEPAVIRPIKPEQLTASVTATLNVNLKRNGLTERPTATIGTTTKDAVRIEN